MSRMALAGTSLVAAIPSGILAVFAIMALLGSAGDMKPMILGVVAALAVVGVLLALMPVIIVVGKRQAPVAAKAAKSEAVPTGLSGAQTAEIVADAGLDAADSEEAEAFAEDVEDTEALEEDVGAMTDDFQFEDDAFSGDELAEAEPEPEPEPKKKKKKK